MLKIKSWIAYPVLRWARKSPHREAAEPPSLFCKLEALRQSIGLTFVIERLNSYLPRETGTPYAHDLVR